jgi:2-polyprenyl-3-methyl-5-hydroxy-6-metoxy-1,4-benzoquinol methylase
MNTPILPPVYTRIEQHEVFPEISHDEAARYNFLANLNKHVSTYIGPGNMVAFNKRIEPDFLATHQRSFENREEVGNAMKADPQYQIWAALRRSTMEMRQQSGRAMTLRQAEEISKKVKVINDQFPDSLTLNPEVAVPYYLSVMDNHLMPGSYHAEYFEGDVANAANYDSGLFVTSGGMLGKLTDGGGKAITKWMKEINPNFSPKRILDVGCGLGHNTLPLAMAFPDAEVIGIDTGAPMLKYGHARAKVLGIDNVKFVQANIEDTGFDWIQTTMFLHETSTKAMYVFGPEIYRMLNNNGIVLHIEQPQYHAEMPLVEQFMRDWDAFHNNEPFWGAMHDIDVDDWMCATGFKRESLLHFGARAQNDFVDREDPNYVEDPGRSPIWNVFGAWKK